MAFSAYPRVRCALVLLLCPKGPVGGWYTHLAYCRSTPLDILVAVGLWATVRLAPAAVCLLRYEAVYEALLYEMHGSGDPGGVMRTEVWRHWDLF